MIESMSAVWNAIPYVTTGLTLVAFIAACVMFVRLQSIKANQKTLQGTNDEKKVAVLQLVLRRLGLPLEKLGKKEAFELAKGELERMAKQDLHRFVVTIVGMVLLAAVALFSMHKAGAKEDPSPNPITPTLATPISEPPSDSHLQPDSFAGVFCEDKNVPKDSISNLGIFDTIQITLAECAGSPGGGSKYYKITWPKNNQAISTGHQRPGYHHCIPSDLNNHAPEFVNKMKEAFTRINERVPCKAKVDVHRFLDISYTDSEKRTQIAKFVQTYNNNDNSDFDIIKIDPKPIQLTNHFDTSATGKKLDELLISEAASFNIPNIPLPIQDNPATPGK